MTALSTLLGLVVLAARTDVATVNDGAPIPVPSPHHCVGHQKRAHLDLVERATGAEAADVDDSNDPSLGRDL